MPLYEYECTACRKHTEKIQKFSDPEITVCPYCGGDLKRVISAPAFAMKGGGWYADGYASAKPATATGADAGTKTDAPPAAAATPAAPASAAPAAAPAASSGDKK